MCLDCGQEERGKFIGGTRVFIGKSKRFITMGELRQYRRKNKALRKSNPSK